MALAKAYEAQCKALKVGVSDKALRKLEDAEHYPHTLQLAKVHLTAGGVSVLMSTLRAVKTAHLREMSLDFVKIGLNGAHCLRELVMDPQGDLRRLSIVHCSLGDDGGALLCEDLGCLEKLDLSDNGCNRKTAEALTAYFYAHKKTSLASLRLDKNNFGDRAGSAFVRSLSGNQTLEELSLVSCGLSFNSASALLEVEIPKIKYVNLRHNVMAQNKLDMIDCKFNGRSPRSTRLEHIEERREPLFHRRRSSSNALETAAKQQGEALLKAASEALSAIQKPPSRRRRRSNVSIGEESQGNKRVEEEVSRVDALVGALRTFSIECKNTDFRELVENVIGTLRNITHLLQDVLSSNQLSEDEVAQARRHQKNDMWTAIDSLGQYGLGTGDQDSKNLLALVQSLQVQLEEKQQEIEALKNGETFQEALTRSCIGPKATSASSVSLSEFQSVASESGDSALYQSCTEEEEETKSTSVSTACFSTSDRARRRTKSEPVPQELVLEVHELREANNLLKKKMVELEESFVRKEVQYQSKVTQVRQLTNLLKAEQTRVGELEKEVGLSRSKLLATLAKDFQEKEERLKTTIEKQRVELLTLREESLQQHHGAKLGPESVESMSKNVKSAASRARRKSVGLPPQSEHLGWMEEKQ